MYILFYIIEITAANKADVCTFSISGQDKIDQPVSILLYTNRGICRMNMRNKITTCVQVINEVKIDCCSSMVQK
jgi:hypothetical protein